MTKRGHAKILDFGLAKVTQSRREPGSDATRNRYARRQHLTSPGHARHCRLHVAGAGASERTGCADRSVLLWRGAVRDGDRAIAIPRRQFSGHLSTPFWIATPVPPVRLNPDLPAELEDIINKALEKDRELRYQHAADMRADLKRLKRDTETGRSRRSQFGGAMPVAR